MWEAFRAPEPTALAEWATRETPGLPYLAPALLRLLEELPAPGDGLSGTERRALQAVAAGAATPAAAFAAYQLLEPAPFLGDAWFFRTLAGLAGLVETKDGPLPPPPPLGGPDAFLRVPLRLTREGELVLRGEADRVELLGLDRWVGGTHITRERAWRFDPAGRRVLSP